MPRIALLALIAMLSYAPAGPNALAHPPECELALANLFYADGTPRPIFDADAASLAILARYYPERHALLIASYKHDAAVDSTSGIPNRKAMEHRLTMLFNETAEVGAPITLVVGDVNWFKLINDILGHPPGDEFLGSIGAALEDSIRNAEPVAQHPDQRQFRTPPDLIQQDYARMGGDEFLIALPGATSTQAGIVIQRFQGAMAADDQALRTVASEILEKARHSREVRALLTRALGPHWRQQVRSYRIGSMSFGIAERLPGETWQDTTRRAWFHLEMLKLSRQREQPAWR